MKFSEWSDVARADLERVLRQSIDHCQPAAPDKGDTILHQAMAYGLLGGGKRIRGLLALAAGEATDASRQACLSVGAALECIHAFSLVHDDMPCMDDDALRRGQPTVHVKFGQAQALLVGDALQTLGFEWVAQAPVAPAVAIELVKKLAVATGVQGMAGGQAIDIHAVGHVMTQFELESMHALKTGALISAAVEMGAICGSPTPQDLAALRQFADCLGLAFQVIDDVLDVSADAATLGKTPGKDAAANKPTFVALLGLTQAQGYARDLHHRAIEAIAPLGGRAARLEQLAGALLERKH